MASSVVRIKLQRNEKLTETADGGITVTHSYLVLLDGIADYDERVAWSATVGVPLAGDSAAVPSVGDYLPASNLMASAKEVGRIRGRVWRVTLTYTPYNPGFEVAVGTGIWNKSVNVTGVQSTEGVNTDKDGKVITNMFGTVLPPQFQKVWYDERIAIDFDCNTLNADHISAVRGTVSNDSVTMNIRGVSRTFPAKTLKLESIDYSATVSPAAASSGGNAFHVSLVLMYRNQIGNSGAQIGWTRRIPQMAYQYHETSGGTSLARSPVPVFLASDGTKLNDGDPAIFIEKLFETQAAFTPLLAGL